MARSYNHLIMSDAPPFIHPAAHDVQTTGVVIVDHGSRRPQSNAMLERFVAQFAAATPFKIVEPAHMELADPSIAAAFDRCVQRGARRVLVCPYFLLPGKHWHHDIPRLTAAAAARHPHVPYAVTAPIGLNPLMVQVIESGLAHCLEHLAGRAPECAACAGTGSCTLHAADPSRPSAP
jgi:sirohydrochlorin ferrochelatase